MASSELRYQLLASCLVKGVNWNVIAREARRPGGLERLMNGETTESSEVAADTTRLLMEARDTESERLVTVQREIEKAVLVGARLATVFDDEYPLNLRLIHNAPPFVFWQGDLTEDDVRAVAVVGTRHPTPEGIDEARRMATLLAKEGVTVVSGLAAGIDTAAHESALEAGGRTIAVAGTGILRTYPPQNEGLAQTIVERGAIVSQFMPTSPPGRHTFPLRNVVTSGISQGTVVIEASSTSGAKMQARIALEHGKRVFLIRSLVLSQHWAQSYSNRPRVTVVDSVDDVMAHIARPARLDRVDSERRQLSLDLS